jgi:RecA/RadA recombinase
MTETTILRLQPEGLNSMSEIKDIDGIGDGVAKKLRQQGIETVEELADADPDEISVPTGNADLLVDRANRAAIDSTSASDLLDQYAETSFVTTGISELDDLLGGGWEAATLALIYGKSGTGKTQLAFNTMAHAASEGTVVYIQTENQSKSIAERIASLAEGPEVLENIEIYEEYSIDKQRQAYEDIKEEFDDIQLLVVDSLTAQFRVDDSLQGRQNLGDRATALGSHLNVLAEIARREDIPIVCTGQVYPTPDRFGGDKAWGGEKMKHFVSHFVYTSHGQGDLMDVALENHPGIPEDKLSVNITEETIEAIE